MTMPSQAPTKLMYIITLFTNLVTLPLPAAPMCTTFRPRLFRSGLPAFEDLFLPADEHGEGAVPRAGHAAAHGGVEDPESAAGTDRRDLPHGRRMVGARVDECRSPLQAGEHAVLAEGYGFHLPGAGKAGDHRVAPLPDIGGLAAPSAPSRWSALARPG